MGKVLFGPAGNSLSFYEEGLKSTLETPMWLKKQGKGLFEGGLDLFEYSFGQGFRMTSEKAKEIFIRFNIPFSYHTLAEAIINRKGDGMCPMEKAIESVSDPEEAYQILKKAVYQIKGGVV